MSFGLVLALAGLPLLATADSPVEVPPGISVPVAAPSPVQEPAQETAQQTTTEMTQKPAPAPMGRVARASFTTAVVAREPQDTITSLSNENMQIIFFSELHGAQDQTVFHVWERDGTEMARVSFDVGGSRWRVYSTKNLEPSWLGEWTVRVEDADGRELDRGSFSYVSAASVTAGNETSPPVPELPPVLESTVVPVQPPPADLP
jgi:hypothetical protein